MSNILEQASLVLVPSGYKESKIYSQIPIDGDGDLQFTRASNATRVNSAGLIEKVRTNLLTYSEDFSNAAWTKVVTTFSGDTLTADAGVALKLISQSQTTQGLQNIYFDVQYVNHQFLQILVGSSGADVQFANFDIQNKVLGSSGGGVINRKIEDFGTFVRISMSLSPLNKVTAILAFVDSGTAARAALSSSTGSFKLFRSQNQTGDVATDYIPTTTAAVSVGMTANVPRLDYSQGSCPRLLLEPQRTSNSQFSESFDNAYWTKTNVTLTSTLGGPIDQSKYFTITCDGTVGTFKGVGRSFLNDTAATYTLSVFAKAGTSSAFVVSSRANLATNDVRAIFNLSNGTITDSNGGTATITPYGDGWYRCTFTIVNAGTFTNQASFFFGHPHGAANGATLLATGAMSETGAYPTSYIPTLGTSVTRVADRAEIQDGDDVLPTSYPFTLYIEVDLRGIDDSWVVSLLNRNVNNIYYIVGVNSDNKFAMISRNITISSINSDVNATEGTHKLCGVFTDSTIKLFVDGVLLGSGTNNATFTTAANDFLIGQFRISSDTGVRNSVKQAIVFNSALTDTQCIQLTTI